MESTLYSEILTNFENLYESKENYDVVIQAGEGHDQKEVYAHSSILRCQSDYFNTAFSFNWAKRKNGKYILEKPNIPSHILEIIIRSDKNILSILYILSFNNRKFILNKNLDIYIVEKLI